MNNTTPTDQANAIRWFLENRRDDVSFEEAIRRLRFALHGDAQAQSILEGLAGSHSASTCRVNAEHHP